jgi:anthranilate synthase component 1
MSHPLTAVELGAWVDPEALFLAVQAAHSHVFWLDAGPGAATGWSWVGAGSPERNPERVRRVRLAGPGGDDGEWHAGRFRGGWIGWLAYDGAARRAGAPAGTCEEGAGEAQWLRAERFVAFDHAAGRAWACAPGADAADLARWAEGAVGAVSPPPAPDPAPATSRHSAQEYETLIERCRDAIREGDAYQLCLTTRFEVAASVDPVQSFRRLRAVTPAHHGGLVRFPDIALVSASPERFLEVEHGVVRTRPIKGTRPRGADAVADAALAAELGANEKERAENVMIVDLMRNDLSRVCEAGSVRVERPLEIETYPAVHQLVSTVAGDVRAGVTVGELLHAAFPAGSMTGAPKLSAMTILQRLEGAPRGVFAGCFGWVGDDGALDLAMVIRSIVVRPDSAYVGAGGGITWRSDAAAEVSEVGIKARGPLAAIGASLPTGW